ncbi:hypothetical protein OXX79_005868 [Metschnikowia pulcherrima]
MEHKSQDTTASENIVAADATQDSTAPNIEPAKPSVDTTVADLEQDRAEGLEVPEDDEEEYDPEAAWSAPVSIKSSDTIKPEESEQGEPSGESQDRNGEESIKHPLDCAQETEHNDESYVTEKEELFTAEGENDTSPEASSEPEPANEKSIVSVENAEASPSNPDTDTEAGQIPQASHAEATPSSPESDDDYDPEKDLGAGVSNEETLPDLSSNPSSTKTPTESEKASQSGVADLSEAYEAVMQSEVVRSEHFAQLSKEKQMEVIQKLLQEKQISLPNLESPLVSIPSSDQVSSSNLVPSSATEYSLRPDVSIPMNEEEQKAFEDFLIAEKEFLNSGEELPEESRLFVGNLPSDLVKKEDLFRLFRRYGELVEISLKVGYGFAQFRTVEACAACKNGEANMPLYNRSLRLDSSHKRKSTQLPENSGRGRERSADNEFEESNSKRRKANMENVLLVVTDKAAEPFVAEVEQAFQTNGLTKSLKNVGAEDPNNEVREAAYSGVLGACVVKDTKVDLQVFEETGDGGVRFDEYLNIDPSAACEILNTAKSARIQNDSRQAKTDQSKRRERATKWKQAQSIVNKHNGYQNDRRRGMPDRPSHFDNHNDGGRGQGRPHWQRNNGRPRNDWNYNMPRGDSYAANAGHGGNFYQGHGSGYNPSSYQQAQAFHNDHYAGQVPQQGFNSNVYQNQGRYQGGSIQGRPTNFTPQMGYNNMSPVAQPFQAGPTDPALMQTLQNLDPNTMRSVVALLQQQSGAQGPIPQGPPAFQNAVQAPIYQQSGPSAQVNSLLSQLQSQPNPSAPPVQSPFPQQPQQPYNSADSQQAPPNKALMDMLSRLGQ